MGLLKDAIEAKKFDRRLVEKNIRRGVATKSEAEKDEKGLSDDESNGHWLNLEELKSEDTPRSDKDPNVYEEPTNSGPVPNYD